MLAWHILIVYILLGTRSLGTVSDDNKVFSQVVFSGFLVESWTHIKPKTNFSTALKQPWAVEQISLQQLKQTCSAANPVAQSTHPQQKAETPRERMSTVAATDPNSDAKPLCTKHTHESTEQQLLSGRFGIEVFNILVWRSLFYTQMMMLAPFLSLHSSLKAEATGTISFLAQN